MQKMIRIKNILQNFVWIEPGEFLIGSPNNEPERWNDELQHKVILTKGYWLADTACTQALWQAVMGKNPSHFKGNANLPVEQVSWKDCMAFIEKANSLHPGLVLRLPTEAEWEYACRAGTATPFSFGSNITPEQVNYNGDYPYNGGQKGEYREKTVPVQSFPPNAWGLYEMHGNVWEWCADWYSEYQHETVTDPGGSEQGANRIVRGGGWIFNARYVRSACRLRYNPAFRWSDLGFRLAADEK